MQGESLVSQSKWWIELLMEISFSRLSSFGNKILFVKYIYIFNKFLKFLRNNASILLFLIFILFSISL